MGHSVVSLLEVVPGRPRGVVLLGLLWFELITWKNLLYYVNTNEIPGEILREKLISSHVKITCYLHLWKYHRCYGFIVNRTFHTKNLLKWNGLVVHWCKYNKWSITWLLLDTKFSFFFFNTWREIWYLHHVTSSIMYFSTVSTNKRHFSCHVQLQRGPP